MDSSARNARRWPDFYVIGASKCGTTSLYHYLKQHPGIFMPSVKEPAVLALPAAEFKDESLTWYLNLYCEAGDSQRRGDATPSYLCRGYLVIPRLEAMQCTHHFVVALRHPVERLWSHYLHNCRRGVETLPLEDALARESERVENHPRGWFSYFGESEYAKSLDPWLSAFDRRNFFFIVAEELQIKPLVILQELFSFLGVDQDVRISIDKHYNVASELRFQAVNNFLGNPPNLIYQSIKGFIPIRYRRYIREKITFWNIKSLPEKPKMEKEVYDRLCRCFHDDVRDLSAILGRDMIRFWNLES